MRNPMWDVFLKELKDIFRDRKSIVAAILIPFLTYPIIFGGIGIAMGDGNSKTEAIEVAVRQDEKSEIINYLEKEESIDVVRTNNIVDSVDSGDAKVGILLSENFDENISENKPTKLDLYSDENSSESSLAAEVVSSHVNKYSTEIIKERFNSKNLDYQIISTFEVTRRSIHEGKEDAPNLMLLILVPFIIVIMCVTGPMPAANDLGAGEKERGTLEPLLLTGVTKGQLLIGKILVLSVIGFLTSMSSLLGLFVGLNFTSGLQKLGVTSFSLDLNLIILIGAIAFLTSTFMGALQLTISIYARSFKEGQTYLTSLNALSLIPIFLVYMVDVKNISFMYLNIPLANVSVLMKEFILGIYNIQHIATVIGWSLLYIFISVMAARYMFNREEVVFRS